MSDSDLEVEVWDLTWLDVLPTIPSSAPMNGLILRMREIPLPGRMVGERRDTLRVPCGCTDVAIVIPHFL
jgi:hypothetical protein